MFTDDAPVNMDDVAGLLSVGAQFFHDFRIIAVGDEADVLRVWFFGVEQAEALRVLARDVFAPTS